MERRQRLTESKLGTKPVPPADLFPGTFYLTEVDSKLRRFYARTPTEA